jgi:hypothetical protein
MAEAKKWGAKFHFPENLQVEYGGNCGSISNRVVVMMAEQYDDFIVSRIAMEARAEGISDLTVLNKRAILNAIKRNTPQKPKEDGWLCCPVCGRDLLMERFKFCPDCGQALDWEEEDNGCTFPNR